MPASRTSPRVLLVGPYERDNLGDLLFLLVTEPYLEGADVTAAAPFASDMRPLLGREIPAYGPLLERERFDVIWSVGGQVGGVDLRKAYRMSATPSDHAAFLRSSRADQDALLHAVAGPIAAAAPYLPAPTRHDRNAGAVTVANSVGLASVLRAGPGRQAHLLATLRGQTITAVRDRQSSRLLKRHGIGHRLAPDAVHAIGLHRPAPPRTDDVAVFQVSRSVLGELGPRRVADALASSTALDGLRLALLPAGTATGHDGVDELHALARRLRRRAPRLGAHVVETRQPLELVDRIATARVVVGSSLHVRIIASAYGVPRVSLARPKVSGYARTWDPAMPHDVAPAALDRAIAQALHLGRAPEARRHAAELAERADAHLRRIAARALRTARQDTPAERAARADERRRQEQAARTEQLLRQEAELAALRREPALSPLRRAAGRARRAAALR
ncbi:MAG TPA: polysaccharide pyruvyl transferase family protein [Capillimicrobium sp.]